MSWDGYGFPRKKTVGQRRAAATKHVARASQRGQPLAPVVIEGRAIATTFWGKAWCDNLERYQDFAYRLDRGRSYVRSGAVIDLAITPYKIAAKVLGSSLYQVTITIGPLARARWTEIQQRCRGRIGSLVDLLAGAVADGDGRPVRAQHRHVPRAGGPRAVV